MLCALCSSLLLTACSPRAPALPTPTKDFEVFAALATNKVPVGASIPLEVRVFHPTGGTVTLPEIDRPKEVVVRRRDRATEPYDADTQLTHFHFDLTSFRLGEHLVSTGMVHYTALDGSMRDEPFPPLHLNIVSLRNQGDAELRDLPEPQRVMSPWRRHWKLWAGAAVALALIALALLHWGSRYKPKLPPAPPPTLPTAHLRALKALAALRERKLLEQGLHEPFVVEVSAILRTYLENRFHLEAPEQTTDEFILTASRSRELTMDHQSTVRQFLELCDLVKFARFTPDSAQGEGLLQTAERFVRETMPVKVGNVE